MTTNLAIRDLSPLAYAITRMAAKITGANIDTVFTPGKPVTPVAQEKQPRQFQYPVAVNMAQQPRRDYADLTPFETLRYLAKKHPLAALCIRVRCEQIAMLPGSYVAKKPAEQASLQADCDALNTWMDKPDRQQSRVAWLGQLIRDLLEIDAPTLYRRPSKGGGLYGLDIIDGATIKPLLDLQGRTVAYQQVIYGLALSQYLGRPVQPGEEQILGEYAPGELWYQPYNPQTTSPYGRAPMEDMLEQASIYLQKQGYDLGHFTEGNIPGALAVFDSSSGMAQLDVQQVADFEQNFNAVLQGDVSRGVKLKFIPFPMKVERLQELSTGGQYESDWEERMVKMTCAFYGVTPAEIGFTADVNRATSDGQQNVTYRRSAAMTQWLKLTIFDPVAHHDFQNRAVEWQWNYGESEDKAADATTQNADIAAGVISAQESRTMRYPNLSGNAPGAPAQPMPLAKRDEDEQPPDEADRLADEGRAERLLLVIYAAQLLRLQALAKDTDAPQLPTALQAFWATEVSTLARAVLPLYDATLSTAALAGTAQLTVQAEWGMVNQAVLKLARDEAMRFAAESVGTSKAMTAQILADHIATNGTQAELIKRLERIYPEHRATMTAITETTRLYAKGNQAAWQASRVVSGYTWKTAKDERVCPECGSLHNQSFADSDTAHLPPAHPSCRCWIVPVVKED